MQNAPTRGEQPTLQAEMPFQAAHAQSYPAPMPDPMAQHLHQSMLHRHPKVPAAQMQVQEGGGPVQQQHQPFIGLPASFDPQVFNPQMYA
eukprot:505807-Pleurochrysis_carterae.AAC.1